MRVVVQRVKHASCKVDTEITGKIDLGFLLFIGFNVNDNEDSMAKVLKKISSLRIFEDENGKMNKSLKDVNGAILAISQFTLYAGLKGNNRPSFTNAMKYDLANEYYLKFCNDLRLQGFDVQMGVFGAMMEIDLLNDGPVTIIVDSEEL